MKTINQVTKVKTVLSRGLATHRPLKIAGVLVLGAVILAGTAIQFAPEVGSDPVNRPYFDESSGETHRLREQQRAADRQEDFQEMVRYWDRLKRDSGVGATTNSTDPKAVNIPAVSPRFTDIDAVDNYLSVDDLRKYVYGEESEQAKVENPVSSKNPNADLKFADIDAVDNYLSVDDLRKYVYTEGHVSDRIVEDYDLRFDDIDPVAEQQRTVGAPFNRDLPDDAWRFGSPYYDDFRIGEENSPSYEQQRSADSIQERLEVQNILQGVLNSAGTKANTFWVDPEVPQDVTGFFGEEVVAALGYEVLTAMLDHYQADGPLTSRDLERLDQDIDMLLQAAADQSGEAETAYQEAIDRLEWQISSMLAEASQDPSTNMRQLDRDVQRLDHQIDMLRLAALYQQ